MEALRLQKEAMQAGTESFLKGAARNVAEKAHEKNKELQYASSNVESVLRQCSTAMATKEELRLSTELVQSTGAAMADRVSQLDRRIDQARARIAEHRTVHGIGLGPDDNTLGLGGGFVEVISEDSSFDEEDEEDDEDDEEAAAALAFADAVRFRVDFLRPSPPDTSPPEEDEDEVEVVVVEEEEEAAAAAAAAAAVEDDEGGGGRASGA